ncbi:hypothetical protein [Hymenobacter psychrophilus]|uniref:Uncharacterized protein n=1 Tax=Hymenobacter psychrophilus TaxID=651662 RepID=A0A1H3B6K5_9BACT|nr:hypothetical protein [Hymenobacter psychrophilus]SDX37543.1 hypothetical protein SAMN04488069_101177 [Hymenobacter psychrophilus]
MTLLISWLGVDSRKPASIYVASDSRISWPDGSIFDYGKKTFNCKNYPDVFGYCGDVLFPSVVLNQLVEIIDQGLLFQSEWNCEQKSQAFIDKFIALFNSYPNQKWIATDALEVIHCSRDESSNFFSRKIRWTKASKKWKAESVKFESYSDKLFVTGSGAKEFLMKYETYWESENKYTSRALFQCFCHTLADIQNKSCGGAPQLVGLYRIKNGKSFGIISQRQRFFQGMRVDNLTNFDSVEWRNELFERCSGDTTLRIEGAQSQPNPLLRDANGATP